MCNDFGNRVPYSAYVEEFSQIRLPLVSPPPGSAPNLEPRDEIWPTEQARVIRAVEGGVELVSLRWGWAPGRPKAPVVINLRSEGRRFANGRCLVPASHYFEFTGTKSPKTRWRVTIEGAEWFCFAAVLGRSDVPGEQAFSLLTVDAGADMQRYHKREPVVLDRGDWGRWLGGPDPEGLLRTSPAGRLRIEESPRVG